MTRQLAGIQYLRGIAAMMVAYVHVALQMPTNEVSFTGGQYFDVGRFAAGVDIFFVISGFVMVATSRSLSPLEFARRRLVRIVPLYWFIILAFAGIGLTAPHLFAHTHITAAALIKSLLFVPYSNIDQSGFLFPMIMQGWTLNVEMFFYLLFALTLIAPLRRFQIPVTTGILLALVLFVHNGANDVQLHNFYSQPRILEFCAGMMLGSIYTSGVLERAAFPLLLCAGFFVLFNVRVAANGIDGLLPATGIVCAVVALEHRALLPKSALLGLLGDASYSIYLTHTFVLQILRIVWTKSGMPGGVIATAGFDIASMIAVAVLGVACYRLLEKPLVNLFRRPVSVGEFAAA